MANIIHFQVNILTITNVTSLYDLDGQFYWSRHMVATVLQPDLDLTEYPKDEQWVVITFESYGLTEGVMHLEFDENPVGYITDAAGMLVPTHQ